MMASDLDFSIQQNRPRRQRRPEQSAVSNYRRLNGGGGGNSDNSFYNYEPVNPRHKGKKNVLRK